MRLARPCQRCGVPFRLHTRADTRIMCWPCLVIEAAKAYDRAALERYGEFACTNF